MNNFIDAPTNCLWKEGNLWYGWAFVNDRYIFDDLGNESVTDLILSLNEDELQDKDTYNPGISISKWSEEDDDMGIIIPFLGRGR